MEFTKAYFTDLIYKINGAAIEVHKALGSGLLESVYHKCMLHELQLRKINVKSALLIPVNYKGFSIEVDLRCDLLVENALVVEFKSVERVLPIHVAQLMTYLQLLKLPIGLMINFNCSHIFSEGQKTYVNELYEAIY